MSAAAITGLSGLARGPKAVAKVMRPKSVAIIGMSARPGSAGQNILNGLKANNFQGDIHLVGRNPEPIDGRKLLASPVDLPEGVDLAVFTLPAAGVKDAVAECVQRKVGAALVFAAGFAETGQHDAQAEVTRTAREGGLAIVGPNCLGYTNNVDGFSLHMLFAQAAKRWPTGAKPGVAFVGQSGGMIGHLQRAADARNMAISYVMTTGNEAGLDLADFAEYMVEDPHTGVIVMYAEQIRRPREFMAACERARAAKKPVVVLHPGRSAKARAAAASHTGALVGDHGAMLTNLANAGALVVDSMDEVMDVSELLLRYPNPPAQGPAVLTASGAFVALINDAAEHLGLEFPALAPATMEKLRAALPVFGTPSNPLDTTAGAAPGANIPMTRALLEDPNIGSLFISYPIAGPKGVNVLGEFIKGMEGNTKPVVVVALGDTSPLIPELQAVADSGPFVFHRSSDRCLRSIAQYHAYGKLLARKRGDANPQPFAGLPQLGKGAQPEWLGKKVLAAAGIRVPEGGLARTVEEAAATAKRIGYPVAVKAQAAALAHKTEAGGVLLNIKDEAGLRAAWDTLQQNVARAQPGLKLDGALVETMASKGLELMVGAKRDAAWGPVLLLGLGGIWVEALGDVRLIPANATEATVIGELQKLRTAKLLNGFRGTPAVDIEAVARTVTSIGRLMLTVPSIVEVDVNPLVALPKGQGVLALDALIVNQ
jgi:acyl-CoA synthetase (NDP forming)